MTLHSRRAIFLGASNLTRHISTVVTTARRIWGAPIDILAALGHGRSYGHESWVLGRGLPGIVECDLWKDLERRPWARTAALVTDIGNDILYGAEVHQIADWVEFCLSRLSNLGARVTITELPIVSLRRLAVWQFRLFRTVLFPGSRLTLPIVLTRAHWLNEHVLDLTRRYGVQSVRPEPTWYGWDPIHIRYRIRAQAWHDIMSPWVPESTFDPVKGRVTTWIRLRTIKPKNRRFLGLNQRPRQPATKLADNSTVSFY